MMCIVTFLQQHRCLIDLSNIYYVQDEGCTYLLSWILSYGSPQSIHSVLDWNLKIWHGSFFTTSFAVHCHLLHLTYYIISLHILISLEENHTLHQLMRKGIGASTHFTHAHHTHNSTSLFCNLLSLKNKVRLMWSPPCLFVLSSLFNIWTN
jgi:hypothetical protein